MSGSTVTWQGTGITGEVTHYYFDAAGNLAKMVQSNGMIAACTYDDLNRLTHLVDFVDGTGADADVVYTVSSSEVLMVCSPKMVPSDMRVSNRPTGPERTLHERQEAHPRPDHRQAA